MKVVIIHGEHITKSLERYDKLLSVAKSRNWQITHISNSDKLSLEESLSGVSLFSEEKLFVIDGVVGLTPKKIEWINKNSPNLQGNLIIYVQGDFPALQLKHFNKDTKVEKFELPKVIFTFLDSFYPGNAKNLLTHLRNLSKNEPAEFVVALLGKRLKDIYLVLSKAKLTMPPWMLSRLTKQAEKFTLEKVEKIIGLLAEADYLSKTSGAKMSDLLDHIIAVELE